ncbi:37S ribosomal protein s5 [Xylariaceae sp. FL1272]|nr:37S ribosomal protein s5 [Xylariaceae sp. FL1272]
MSVARPARSLLSRGLNAPSCNAVKVAPSPRCHAPFHSSASLAKRKPRFKSIRAEELGLVTPEKIDEFAKEKFPNYTPEEMEVLKQKYTPAQMAALEAGEAAIDPRDLTVQGRIRFDSYKLPYLDDFSKNLPIVDKRQQSNPMPPHKLKFMSPEEHADDLTEYLKSHIPKGIDFKGMSEQEIEEAMLEKVDWELVTEKYLTDRSTFSNFKGKSDTALAPELGEKLKGVAGMYRSAADEADRDEDELGTYTVTKRKTGMQMKDINSLSVKILVRRFVTNQTRLGKIMSTWVLAIAGNGDGRLGVGEAKSTESAIAVQKAKLLAIQNMMPIRRYEDRTIFGNSESKFGSTIVKLEARPPGFGLRASHRFFEIFRIVGIKDIAAKMPRGRNPMNSAKACVDALMNQRDPNEIAIGRGKKMVDVRKVYYGGNPY